MPDPACPECNRLLAEICRLNFELGKREGELHMLRQPFIASNREAWEQGRVAGEEGWRAEANPYPKREALEPELEG